METLAKRLASLRRRRGLSATEVAAKVGVPESTYRDWESGRAIRGEPYLRIAQVLDVSLAELLIGDALDRREVVAALDEIEALVGKIRRRL